jgi:hypothetical protein
MDSWPLVAPMLLVGVVLVGVLVTIVVIRRKRGGEEAEVNYLAFFVMGLSLLPMGALLSFFINPGFLGFIGLGAFYVVYGLSKKDKWKPP